VSSHDSVYHGVVRGFYAAGGGIVRTLNNMPIAVQNELRILWTSKPYTSHAIAAHPRVSAKVVERVQRVMEDMHDDPAGRALLQAIRFYQGIESARDAEWDDVRHLGIQLLQNLTRQ
jgi:phosphonate transport system substrate-binding protein